MMGLIINWLVTLCVCALPFVALYFVVKTAVRSGTKEAMRDLLKDMAKEVWKNDGEQQ